MLIKQFASAVLALLIAGTFGFGAAKACAIGLGLFRRSIPFGALPELPQIDGFPHDHLHHSNGWVRAAIPTPRKFSRLVFINSVAIREIPRRLRSFKNHISLCESGIFLCCNTAQRNVGSRIALRL
jgi:hypothetical protein